MVIHFLSQSLKNFKSVGAVAPASVIAAQKMVESVNFETARIIVEFGGGTGPVTKEILKRAHTDARIYVFEIHEEFVRELKQISDPRLTVLHESAADAQRVLQTLGIASVDCVISTLPLAVFEKKLVDTILLATKAVLKRGGVYTQIQYSPILKKRLESVFGTITTLFTPLNIPPAFVYVAKR